MKQLIVKVWSYSSTDQDACSLEDLDRTNIVSKLYLLNIAKLKGSHRQLSKNYMNCI